MRLNTNVWGSEHGKFWYADITGGALTNYINGGNSFFTPTFEQLVYNGETYSNGQLSKMAQLHPEQYNKLIDNSICYAAIPANSPIATLSYLNRTSAIPRVAGRYEAYHGDIPLFLAIAYNGHYTNGNSSMGCIGNGNGYLPNRWSQWTDENIAEWDIATEYPTGGRYIMPITKYNYNDVVIVIKVIVGNDLANPQNYTTLDLADWEVNKEQYPYLYCCYGIPYIGKAGSRFNINNNVNMAYTGFGTTTTRSNYLRLVKNVPMATLPEYHNSDVNDYDQSTPLINYNSQRWLNSRSGYVGTYGISVGVGNASITPNTSLDNFKNTGSIDGESGIYIFAGDDTIIDSYPFTDASRVVTRLKDDIDVRKIMSWYGLQFVDSTGKIQAAIGSDDLCIPIISDDGYTTDEYRSGAESLELPNSDWGEDWGEKNGYSGKSSEQFDDETQLNPNVALKSNNVFTHIYQANVTGLSELANYLYGTLAPILDGDTILQSFMTNNPIDCISDVIMYPYRKQITPFDPDTPIASPDVIIGNTSFNSANIGVLYHDIDVLNLGTLEYRRKFNDFRDFEPYCSAELYIPYHGSVNLTPSIYCGHDITVKILVDLITGASLALIYRDGLVMDSLTGQIGMHIKLSGMQSASYNNAVYSAANGYKQSAVSQIAKAGGAILSTAANLATGNFIGAVASVFTGLTGEAQSSLSLDSAEYQLEHIQVPYKTIGTNTVLTSFGNEQRVRLIIKRPKMLPEYRGKDYAHTTGYATLETAKLSRYSGYTKISAADLSGIPCTAQERADILRLLQSGVYL